MRGLSHPTVTVKKQVIERDGGFCLLALAGCQGEATTTDHRANRQAGGSRVLNDGANLIAACALCNGEKSQAHSLVLLDLQERGLYVVPDSTHAKTLERARKTPVQDLSGDWWLLISATEKVPYEWERRDD